jgi:hypothetical protein
MKAGGFLHQLGTGRAVNGSVHAPPAGQLGVGGIGNRIDLLAGQVSRDQFQTTEAEGNEHAR